MMTLKLSTKQIVVNIAKKNTSKNINDEQL